MFIYIFSFHIMLFYNQKQCFVELWINIFTYEPNILMVCDLCINFILYLYSLFLWFLSQYIYPLYSLVFFGQIKLLLVTIFFWLFNMCFQRNLSVIKNTSFIILHVLKYNWFYVINYFSCNNLTLIIDLFTFGNIYYLK